MWIFKNKAVFKKWFLSYLVMMGLAIMLSVGIYFHSYHIISRQSEEITVTLLDKMQSEIDARFNSARHNLVNLLLDRDTQKAAEITGSFSIGDRELLYDIYKDLSQRCITNGDFRHIFLYFKEGKTILSEQGHMESSLFYEMYYEQEGWSLEEFREILENSWSGEDIAIGNKTGEQEIWILQGSMGRGSDSSATFGVSISEAALNQRMQEILWNESQELLMIHPDGIYIGSGRLADELRRMNYCIPETDSADGKITVELEIEGEGYRMNAVPSSETDFYYLVLTPLGTIEQGARSILIFMAAGLFVCITLGIVIAYLFTGMNYNPLRHIMDGFGNYGKDGKRENSNELQWLLEKSTGVLEDNREIKRRDYNNAQNLRSQYLYRMITLPYESKSSYAKEFAQDAAFRERDNLVILFFLEEKGEGWGQSDAAMHQFILTNVLKELTYGNYGAELVELHDAVACVINGKNKGEETREELENIFDKLQTFVKERICKTLFVACGSFKQGLEGIYDSYCAAREASGYQEQFQNYGVVWYEDIRNRQVYYEYRIEEEQKIINAMKAGEEENVCRWMDEVIRVNFQRKEIPPSIKKCLLFELVGTVMKGVEQGDALELLPQLSFERKINDGMNEEEAREFFHGLIHETCEYIRRQRQAAKEDSQYIRQVIQYVKENYQNPDLNISITALHFKITPSYLSSLFKEETGVSLLEYINHIRVEKIKELLEAGMSIVDICPQAGFRNSGALIRVFKKETGITPGQMKKLKT